jgi:hypothetical protein
MILPIDGPANTFNLSVSTVVELKQGGSPLTERKYVLIQPLDGDVYWGYTSGVTTSTGHRVANGSFFPIPAGDLLPVYIVSAGTVDVRVSEVA